MSTVASNHLAIVRAESVWVWDDNDTRYLDGTASLWYMNVGHGRQEIIDAIALQGRRVAAYSCFGDYSNGPAESLTRMLADLSPIDNSKIFLTSGGGDAIDTAVKLARLYFSVTGLPKKQHVISREGSYHGTQGIGTSITGIPANRVGFGSLLRETSLVANDDPSDLRARIEQIGPERVACFVLEPVIGAGGVYPPVEGYIEQARSICHELGVLFIADSVICGFGRLGTWFGIERFDVVPDMIVFAKGVTSGYLPLGGVVVSPEIAGPFYRIPGNIFHHGPTYAGHPLACAAAVENIEIIKKERLLERSGKLEGPLFSAVKRVETSEIVSEVRGGIGLMAAVQLAPNFLAEFPNGPALLQMAMRKRGVLIRPLGNAIALSPPLVIQESEITLMGLALEESIEELESIVN